MYKPKDKIDILRRNQLRATTIRQQKQYLKLHNQLQEQSQKSLRDQSNERIKRLENELKQMKRKDTDDQEYLKRINHKVDLLEQSIKGNDMSLLIKQPNNQNDKSKDILEQLNIDLQGRQQFEINQKQSTRIKRLSKQNQTESLCCNNRGKMDTLYQNFAQQVTEEQFMNSGQHNQKQGKRNKKIQTDQYQQNKLALSIQKQIEYSKQTEEQENSLKSIQSVQLIPLKNQHLLKNPILSPIKSERKLNKDFYNSNYLIEKTSQQLVSSERKFTTPQPIRYNNFKSNQFLDKQHQFRNLDPNRPNNPQRSWVQQRMFDYYHNRVKQNFKPKISNKNYIKTLIAKEKTLETLFTKDFTKKKLQDLAKL